MEPVYILTNNDDYLIQNKLEELITEASNYEVIKYDLLTSSIEQVIEDLDTYNFLNNNKFIIVSNCNFLTSEGDKNFNEELFLKYIDNPNPLNTLVLLVKKLDERKKIVKKLLMNSKVNVPTLEINIARKIKDELQVANYQMSDSDINYLIDYCLNNNNKIMSELEKLKLYTYSLKCITRDDINNLVTKEIDGNIFSLIDAIIAKSKAAAFEIYQELLSHNEEQVKIMIVLANQFRLLYQVKILKLEGLSAPEIAKYLGIHPYRVKLALEKGVKYQEQELVKCLDSLAVLDYDIKHGNTYENIGLELFILNL
ncbi:MAG: DNA polymerase III subunit delta [Bacilli bacterium]